LQTGQSQRLATLREVTGALVRQQVLELRDELGRIRGADDAEQAHRARISLKRLRYMLEPIARRNRRAGALVRKFKDTQDQLGEHHDMHVLSSAIAGLRTGLSTSSFAGLDAGLAMIVQLADEAAIAAFTRFEETWGGELGHRILLRAEELGRALEEPPLPTGPEESESTAVPAVGEIVSEKVAPPVVTEIG
jgi:CHAD domain-containing protein